GSSTPEQGRQAAVKVLGDEPVKHAEALGGVLGDTNAPFPVRESAARVLGRGNVPATFDHLLKGLTAAPARLQTVIAESLASTQGGADKLLEAVAAGKASARLLRERSVEVQLNNSKLPGLADRVAKLTVGLPTADKKVQDLINQRRDGFRKVKAD